MKASSLWNRCGDILQSESSSFCTLVEEGEEVVPSSKSALEKEQPFEDVVRFIAWFID